MFAITYYSRASYPFNEVTLCKLSDQARDKNNQLGITGFLQYREGHFIQYLEGDKDIVLELMRTISEDSRHELLRMIYLPEMSTRRFNNWYMHYWQQRDISYIKLDDLLNDVLLSVDPKVFGDEFLQKTIIRLVDKMSERQTFQKNSVG